MIKMYIAILDFESNSIRVFTRDFEVGSDVEYELTESGEFSPGTMQLMFNHKPFIIRID